MISDEWAAGFFDGEGCIYIGIQRQGTPRLIVSITQKYRSVLEDMQERFSGGLGQPKPDIWDLRWTGKTSETLLKAIVPYLRTNKKPQAELALEFIKRMPGRGGYVIRWDREWANKAQRQMKEMKHE